MRRHRRCLLGGRPAGGISPGCGAARCYSSAGSLRCGSQRTAAVQSACGCWRNLRLPTHRLRTGLLRRAGLRLLSARSALPHRSGLPGLRPDSELARGESITRPDRLHRPTEPRREHQAGLRAPIAPKAQTETCRGRRRGRPHCGRRKAGQGGECVPFDPIGETAAPEPEAHGAATGAEAQTGALACSVQYAAYPWGTEPFEQRSCPDWRSIPDRVPPPRISRSSSCPQENPCEN